jgi:hypothetical protein
VVVYNVPQPIAPTVIYDTAPVVSPECNESVAPQQSFTDNNCETSPIDEPSISITGRIQLIGLRHQTFIRIPANKSICNGSLIRFYDCKGERVGDFLVTDFDIAKCTVTVQKTWGVEPGNKAGYRINPGD